MNMEKEPTTSPEPKKSKKDFFKPVKILSRRLATVKKPLLYVSLGGFLTILAVAATVTYSFKNHHRHAFAYDNAFNYHDFYNGSLAELTFRAVDNDDHRYGRHDDDDDRYGRHDDDDHRYGRYDDDDDHRYGDRDDDDDRHHRNGRRHKNSRYTHAKKGYGKNHSQNAMYSVFGDTLADYDSNDNGRLSAAERTHAIQARFALVDSNQNGSLESNEFTGFLSVAAEQRLKKRFILMDIDEDGALSSDEQRSQHRRRSNVKSADTNNDKIISQDEFLAFFTEPVKRRAKASFVEVDRNSDKSLSMSEFKRFLNKYF